ncbi:MAG: phenylalanine--tRNA ligase subunit beta [Elusimicrobiales bacterium]|nr:phenylalanine--tRNA ligase subunit beta [Elusimicrobiales bacterium]
MKIVYSWLCEYFESKPDIDFLVTTLKKLGFGVESIQKIGPDCRGVVTAKVLEVKKHPNADRLKVCRVSTGSEEYEVVCGASNVKEGIIVPFATVGAKLKDSILKKAKIRGIESCGMICSASEIGIEDNSDGIMILDENLQLGVDINDIFSRDYIFDIEITPNLSYALSHWGIARELSIFGGLKLKNIPVENNISITKYLDFSIEIKTADCYRYAGIIVKNIKNKNTPFFIFDRLKKIGVNPKGNFLIDLSNYVMFELGQPTHFFDLSKIDSIIVRQALDGEKFIGLDGNIYKLSEDIMVIADNKKVLAVAGIIGGIESAIDNSTSDILIEVANFNPVSIRSSAKKINIKTDSSYRFERTVDYNLIDLAIKRIIFLIKQTNPQAEICFFKDIKNVIPKDFNLEIDIRKIEDIIGIKVDTKMIFDLLKSMDNSFDGKFFKVPSYRHDIKSIWDISEEYLRYIGYDSIETKSFMQTFKSKDDVFWEIKDEFSRRLSVFGFNECYTYDLVSLKDIKEIGFNVNECIKILNPISSDFEYLRPSGLPSMLKVLRYNINRDIKSVKIYEFANTFIKNDNKIEEKRKLFILMWGFNNEWEWWKEKKVLIDFFDLKTVIDFLFNYEVEWLDKGFNFGINGGVIVLNDKEIGWGGEVKKSILKNFDIKVDNVFYVEIDIEQLRDSFESDFYSLLKKPKKPSQYQSGIRDLSIIIDKKYKFSEIRKAILDVEDIEEIRLIDVYEDSKLGKDKRSFTFRFIFSSYNKTFTDEELNKKIEKIFLILKEKFYASLR